MDTEGLSSHFISSYLHTHKIDHCTEGTANNKTIAVREDLPRTVLITSKDGDQGNTNHGSPIFNSGMEFVSDYGS